MYIYKEAFFPSYVGLRLCMLVVVIVLIIVVHNELYIVVHTLAKIMIWLYFQNTMSIIIVKLCFENIISQIIKHNFNSVNIIPLVSSNNIVL